jgi:hypothetical protein
MGQYVNQHLMPSETVVYEAQYHWVHYFSKEGLLSLGIIPLLHRYFHEFVVTNRRIIMKKEVIMVDTFEMNFSRVERVQVNQSIIGSAGFWQYHHHWHRWHKRNLCRHSTARSLSPKFY